MIRKPNSLIVNYLFIYLCIFVHLPDVFEWLAISLSSFGLVLATIILLLKRRRLRHNDTRPLQVRTVICYHNGQDDVARMRHGTAAEIHPLCENDSCTSLMVRDQGQAFPFWISVITWEMIGVAMTTQSSTNILFASKLLTVYGPSSMASRCDPLDAIMISLRLKLYSV